MALLSHVHSESFSGWALVIGAEEDDIARFEKEEWAAMRKGARERMRRSLRLYLSEIKHTLGRELFAPSRRFSWLSGRRLSSAPGDPPAKVSGDLIRSWVMGFISWSMNDTVLTGRIQSAHPAAGRLEYGDPPDKGAPNIAARPYARPTIVRIADRVHDLLLGL